MTIRIGIMGYGNLGRGVECAIKQNPDMELAAVFTRRDPKNVRILTEGAKVYHADEAKHMTDKIDVLILCGGSVHYFEIRFQSSLWNAHRFLHERIPYEVGIEYAVAER